MNREGGALDATQGKGPTHRPLPVCASLPLYRERQEQHHERHHEQHMTGTMSLPLFADGVSRVRQREFAHYHGVPHTMVVEGPSKDAPPSICRAAPPAQRMAESGCHFAVKPSEDRRRNASGITATVWRVANTLPGLGFVERLSAGEAVA
jgi:hypothetical protein